MTKESNTGNIFDMPVQDVLEDKRIAAGIIKSYVPEYAALSVPEIADLITYLPASGSGNMRVTVEDDTWPGGTVRFEAAIPGTGCTGEFLIDVEPSEFDSLMEVQLRELGYFAYLISLTCGGDWEKLENPGKIRFFTVSIYSDPPEGYEDEVLTQSLPGEAIARAAAPAKLQAEIAPIRNYINVVSVFLGQPDPRQEFSLGFANTVFDTNMSAQEKTEKLWDEFGAPMDDELQKAISET